MAKKAPFTMESNLEKITEQIHERPKGVLIKIGWQLVKEIKATTLKDQYKWRYKILAKSLKATNKDEDGKKSNAFVKIGFEMSIPGLVGGMITGREADPLRPVVLRNNELIQKLVGESLDQIRKG